MGPALPNPLSVVLVCREVPVTTAVVVSLYSVCARYAEKTLRKTRGTPMQQSENPVFWTNMREENLQMQRPKNETRRKMKMQYVQKAKL